jgi:RimJ/RimL family protein N-acetyltransferase
MSFYPQVYSEEQVAAMIRQSIETHRRHGYGRFAVIENVSGELIGDCGITIQDIDGKQEYELGSGDDQRAMAESARNRPNHLTRTRRS